MTLRLRYDSNNSGGSWWLSDDAWRALEAAGWNVDWIADREKGGLGGPDADGRWLGALATSASKPLDDTEDSTIQAALSEWDEATGESRSDQGCNCCGPPHNFYVEDGDDTLGSIEPQLEIVDHGWSLSKW